MHFSLMKYTPVVSQLLAYWTVYNHLMDCFEYVVVSFLVVSLLDGLQLSNKCFSISLSIKLLVFQLLAY